MSFDLEVVTTRRIEFSQLANFVATLAGFQVTGTLGNEANVLVTRQTASKTHSSFTVDGPFKVELDDLTDEIVAATLDPKWLVQISAPASATKTDLKAAKDMARFIAESCQGSVFDPQSGRVIWPRQKATRYIASSNDERIRLVGLDWFLPVSLRPSTTATTMLQILRRTFPESLPTRFGTFEPLQHRLEAGDDQPFVKLWSEQSDVEFGGSFYWKAKSPCYGGSVFFPDWRDKFRPEGVDRAIHLAVSIDGRALHSDPRWCETVVTLFGAIARRLRAFYAMGYVQRDVIARTRSIWFDGKTEGDPIIPGRWWLGLPPMPTWLTWFGAGYAREVEKSLPQHATSITPEGILLRLGAEPLDRDELRGSFPRLPEDLVARKEGNDFRAASRIASLE
ncbi:MAG TPA: hypothetical protein VFF31_33805 [Blastocatellia bacterium]|nr:hypothetical protein [Blastocatellia bacterium]